MLKLESLTLENFGPFKHKQVVEFPSDGVQIIYGDNGMGKTHLLNALRFALFGTILGRSGKAEDLAGFVNREAVQEGHTGFSVTLALNSDGVNYRLTRYLANAIGAAVTRPQPMMTLTRNEVGLGPQEAEAQLGRLLPEKIARFFLFDGELLQQYEELLRDHSDVGERIKESIERILGVPVLQNARSDIVALLGEANREVGRAAEGDQRTRQIGLSLQNTQDELDARQENAKQLRKRITDLEGERENLEAQLVGTERIQRLFGERVQLRGARARLRTAVVDVTAEIQALSATAWRAVLAPQLRQVISHVEKQIEGETERRNKALLASQLRAALATAQQTGTCPTCGTQLEPGTFHAPDDVDGSENLETIETSLAALRQRRATLRSAAAEDSTDKLNAAQTRMEDAQVALSDVESDLKDVEEKLTSYDDSESNLRQLAQTYASVGEALSTGRTALETEHAEIARREDTIERLKAQLLRIHGGGRADVERRAVLLSQLAELFTDAITRYREQLRADVEREATEIFRDLKQEPDFDRLRINENYGLEIVHRDGTIVERRSAGQEHIVALSLIAGLQRCAPIRGPIIMDSLFGRLDEHHTRNVVRTLPRMADQVVVLVYETELDRQMAIQELDGSLRSELRLERVNGRHTSIEERTD